MSIEKIKQLVEQFIINVTNINEAPTEITLSSNSIQENNLVNAVIGTLSTNDPDVGNTHTYTLVSGTGDDNNDSFNINGNQLRAGIVFDFETKSPYSVRIRATDNGGFFFERG